uniref:Phosphorylated adapter RNA export protein n=1 Tax=Trichuris muris TaxID=70415 RepID=A0A5S6QUK8_TRIMR
MADYCRNGTSVSSDHGTPSEQNANDWNTAKDDSVRSEEVVCEKPSNASPESGAASFNAWSELLIESELVGQLGQTSGALDLSENMVIRRGVESYSVQDKNADSKQENQCRGPGRKWHSYNRRPLRQSAKWKLKEQGGHVRVLPKFQERNGEPLQSFVKRLANCLQEKEVSVLNEIVNIVGRATAVSLYDATAKLEKEGGIMTKDNSRRRLPGGVFMHLATEDNESGEKVKEFFKKKRMEKRSINRKRRAAENSKCTAKRVKPNLDSSTDVASVQSVNEM